jgi:hypothetical protein
MTRWPKTVGPWKPAKAANVAIATSAVPVAMIARRLVIVRVAAVVRPAAAKKPARTRRHNPP